MTDDLAKQLRLTANLIENGEKIPPRMDILFMRKAAERIDELDDTIKGLRHMILDHINSTGDDPEIMAASRAEWAARALAAEARVNELKATLKKLEYWFDTDQEILDVMGNNEKADHMRKLKMIRDALGGDSDG